MKRAESQNDSNIKKEIGKRIQAARKSSSPFLSAEKVAKKLGITRGGLSQIERGQNNATGVMLWKLSCILGCPIENFFPNVPDGFQLTKRDIEEIKKEDEKAVEFAKKAFGEPTNND